MHFDLKQQRLLAEESKDKLRDLMVKYDIMQHEVAFGCGVEQSTISRWTNPQTDMYPSIFLISNCLISGDRRLEKLAKEFLDWLEELAGRSAQPLTAKADGSLRDEFEDAAIAEGRFAKALKSGDLDEAAAVADELQAVVVRMRAELKEKRATDRKAGTK